jgi:chorismate mutase/prephenate dehydratase
VIDAASPAAAAELSAKEPGVAAIVPRATGEAAGLAMLRANVGDDPDLRIRFALASRRAAWRSGADTTAVLFGVSDQPGVLFDVLHHFAERGVNLKAIHSRPVPGESWNYVFYVEVSGHVTDRAVTTALEDVKRQARFVKVLGSFPAC